LFYPALVFIRRTGRKNGSTQLKIIESVRVGDKIVQKAYATVGVAKDRSELEALERIAKQMITELLNGRDPALPGFEGVIHGSIESSTPSAGHHQVDLNEIREEKRINVGMEDVFGAVYSQMDFEDVIAGTRKDEEWNGLLKDVILARLFDPGSKRNASNEVLKEMNKEVPLEKIYRMMDRLVPLEEAIKKKIFQSSMSLLDFEVDVLFFDVTTLYFESFDPDELRAFGFSKDCKFKETQIVLALVTNNRGVPLTYELFPGNESEGNTLINIVKKIKANYTVKNVVLVADRAMFSEKNLAFLESEKMHYIVAAKLKAMKRSVQSEFLNETMCPFNGWVKDLDVDKRRLIVSYSMDRAKKDYKQRMRLVDRLLKKARDGKIAVKDLINNNGTKKYIEVHGEKASINEAKVLTDAQWDGIHGVITNYSREDKTPNEILEKYKGLWKIEEVFRINKHDLRMRPIYHRKPERIRAHILICFMAYVMLNTTKQLLEKNSIKLSVSELRKEIGKRQASIIRDKRTQRRFFVPGSYTETQRQIYNAFRIPVIETVQPLFKQS
jgi:transposase